VSLLGIYVTVYAQPCWRVVMLVGLIEIAQQVTRFDAKTWIGVPRIVAGGVVAAIVGMFVAIPPLRGVVTTTIPHVIDAHFIHHQSFEPNEEWARTLHDGQAILDAHRGPHGELPSLWSTYAGWLEARNDIFHPSFDYIIHALGPENRAAYIATFRRIKPALVQTVVPTYTQYEPWIESTSWDLYADLLRDYRVAGHTSWSIFWERRAEPGDTATVLASFVPAANTTSITLPPTPTVAGQKYTLMEVEVAYDVHNTFRRLPLFGTLPRYIVAPINSENRDAISLDPYTPSTRFPVIALPGSSVRLAFHTFSLLGGASLRPTSVRVSLVPVDPANRGWLGNLVAEMHTPAYR
jgi:hypothetical protein